MDKNVLFNTAMLPLSGLQHHAVSLVTTHRGHFLPTSASHGFPHPCLWAGRQHFAQENTPCSFSPLERGFRHSIARFLKSKRFSAEWIQNFLGHESYKTTMDMYGTLSIDEMQEVAERLLD